MPVGRCKFADGFAAKEKSLENAFVDQSYALGGNTFIVYLIMSGQKRAVKLFFVRIVGDG